MRLHRRAQAAALALCASPLFAADHFPANFDGYVTRISNGVISVGDVDVSPDSNAAPAALRIGDRVHVVVKSEHDGHVLASSIQVRATDASQHVFNGDSLLSGAPDLPRLTQHDGHWTGTLYLGGIPMQVTDSTVLSGEKDAPFSPDLLVPTTRVTYTSHRASDGRIIADTLIFAPHPITDDELKALKNWRAIVTPPAYMAPTDPKSTDKSLNAPNDDQAKEKGQHVKQALLNDERVQNYVKGLGQRIIPAWQRATAPDDPQHINFEFWVADGSMKGDRAFNMGGGVIIVPLRALMNLDNEAQLAAMLSAAISFELQRKLWDHRIALRVVDSGSTAAVALLFTSLYTSPVTAAGLVAMHKFVTRLNDDAACEGLPYLIAAGYDPREAPAANEWGAGKGSPGVLSPGAHMDDTVSRVNAALTAQTVNFDSLKVGRNDLAAIQTHVLSLDKSVTHLKKTPALKDGSNE